MYRSFCKERRKAVSRKAVKTSVRRRGRLVQEYLPGLSEGSAPPPRSPRPPPPRPPLPRAVMGEVMGRWPCDGGRRDAMAGTVMGRWVPYSSIISRRVPRRDDGLRSDGADFSSAWSGAGLCRRVRKTRSSPNLG
eukprot:scaffold99240_cov72-Phaeocystis_antarctica.AAC.2